MKIKNWEQFQRYKRPGVPWIKLHVKTLNDPEWHDIKLDDRTILTMLWMLAAESNDGTLPPIKNIAFRCRLPEKVIETAISHLSHFVVNDVLMDSQHVVNNVFSEGEGEGETEGEYTSNGFDGFAVFWAAYPKKVEKQKVVEWFKKKKPTASLVGNMIAAIEIQKESDQWQRGFIKNPLTWLNRGCWEDEPGDSGTALGGVDQWLQEASHDQT